MHSYCLLFNKFAGAENFQPKRLKVNRKSRKSKKSKLLKAIVCCSVVVAVACFLLFAIGMRRQFFFRISIHTLFVPMANCRRCVYVTLFSFPLWIGFCDNCGCGRRTGFDKQHNCLATNMSNFWLRNESGARKPSQLCLIVSTMFDFIAWRQSFLWHPEPPPKCVWFCCCFCN